MVDATVYAAGLGLVPALFAVWYTKRSVDEMRRQTEARSRSQAYLTSRDIVLGVGEIRREWAERLKLTDEDFARAPAFREAITVAGDVEGVVIARMYVERLQEAYFARKLGLVTDEHWRAVRSLMGGFFFPDVSRRLFPYFRELGFVTPEFAAFADAFLATGLLPDPLGRVPEEVPRPVPVSPRA